MVGYLGGTPGAGNHFYQAAGVAARSGARTRPGWAEPRRSLLRGPKPPHRSGQGQTSQLSARRRREKCAAWLPNSIARSMCSDCTLHLQNFLHELIRFQGVGRSWQLVSPQRVKTQAFGSEGAFYMIYNGEPTFGEPPCRNRPDCLGEPFAAQGPSLSLAHDVASQVPTTRHKLRRCHCSTPLVMATTFATAFPSSFIPFSQGQTGPGVNAASTKDKSPHFGYIWIGTLGAE